MTEREWLQLVLGSIERDLETDHRILTSVVSRPGSPVMMGVRK